MVRTFDHPFPQRWREGTPVSYDLKLYQSAMAPPLPPGKYQVTLGLYGKDGKRWAARRPGRAGGARRVQGRRGRGAERQTPARASPSPRPGWTVEPGGDRQVLARRWLVEPGGDPPGRSARGRGRSGWSSRFRPPTSRSYKAGPRRRARAPRPCWCQRQLRRHRDNLSGSGLHEVELASTRRRRTASAASLLNPNFTLEPHGRSRQASARSRWRTSPGSPAAAAAGAAGRAAGRRRPPTAPR